jgi:PAS domain S-box-containing protein
MLTEAAMKATPVAYVQNKAPGIQAGASEYHRRAIGPIHEVVRRMAGVDSQLIQWGRDRVVRDALPGVAAGIAVLQAVLAVVHGTVGRASERPLVLVDAASAVVAVGLYFVLGKGTLPERWAHPFATGLGAVAALVVLVHIRVLADPLQTLMLALVVVGAGSLFLSYRWLALLAGASLLGWLAVMASLRFPPGSRRLGIALLGSWALAVMILSARLRSFLRLEELRAQNEARLTGDVTEARSLADSMRQSEESHRLLFEKSPLPMWVVERESLQFLAVNDAALRNYGYSRPEFLEMTLRDVNPPEDVPGLLAYLAGEPSEQHAPLTVRHLKKDHAVIDVEIIAHDIAFGEWKALLAVMTDVTERRKSEKALRRSRESFQQLFEEAPIGMAMMGYGAGFAKVNRALCEMLGYSKEELSGLGFDRFVDPADKEAHLAVAQEFFEGKRSSFKVEARYLRKSGAPLWGSLTVERIEDSTGQMLYVLVMVEDISERHRAVEERERMIDELKEALANVKTLRGLIPICASCKKIRDDKGYWSQVEVYVRDRSDAEFSHGICPDCMKTLYGR